MTTHSAIAEFAVWLIPAAKDRRWLSKVIQDYAVAYDAPVFEPHVTVYNGVAQSSDNLSAIMKTAITPIKPLKLEVMGLNYTEDFFKTGFIVFAPNEHLSQLSQSIRDRLSSPLDYSLDLHLSLIYKDISLDQKRLAMLRMVLSVQTITFDTVKIMTPGPQGWANVSQWTETLTYSLTGS